MESRGQAAFTSSCSGDGEVEGSTDRNGDPARRWAPPELRVLPHPGPLRARCPLSHATELGGQNWAGLGQEEVHTFLMCTLGNRAALGGEEVMKSCLSGLFPPLYSDDLSTQRLWRTDGDPFLRPSISVVCAVHLPLHNTHSAIIRTSPALGP